MSFVTRKEILNRLREQLEPCLAETLDRDVVTTGVPPLDCLLPRGGLARGTLVEWLSAAPASGGSLMALLSLCAACREQGVGVVCDFSRQWNPQVAYSLAKETTDRLFVLRTKSLADERWAAEQALGSPAVAAVWLPCEQLHPRDFRRLQLAAEAGGALGIVLRPAKARSQSSWADVRLWVEPRPSVAAGRRLRVEVLRCRGGREGRSVELVLDDRVGQLRAVRDNDETLPVPAASPVADSAAHRRSTGA